MTESSKEIREKTLSGGKYYAVISIVSQIISWVFTFLVIRLLDPEDYGLMAMAAFITSFIHVFSALGLGAGIVQREDVNQQQLSSVFWFSMLVGLVLSVVVFGLAYPNALIFDNPDLIPITQLISFQFIISAIATVPQNILSRNYKFKEIALVNMWAAMISSVASVYMAYIGWGVYTLIWSSILLSLLRSLGFLYKSKWLPDRYFNFEEVKSFLKFGVKLSLAASFMRFLDAVDKLIVGKIYNAVLLGYYTTAISIANMPIDKLSPLINPVILPMFSRWQKDNENTSKVYLSVLKYYMFMMAVLYLGGLAVADNLILLFLGMKWIKIIPIFKVFCIVQLFKVLSSYHKILMTARGQANKILIYDVIVAALLVLGVLFAALKSFDWVAYAWLIIYPIITVVWIISCLTDVGISIKGYFKSIAEGVAAAMVMLVALIVFKSYLFDFAEKYSVLAKLSIEMGVAGVVFLLFVYFFQKDFIANLINTLFKKQDPVLSDV